MIESIKELIYKVSIPVLSKIKRFKGVHNGESCYLFGDGISLKWFELRAFADKISIPVGLLPFHNDFKELNTKYALLIEPYWFYPFEETTTPPIKKIRNRISEAYRSSFKENPNTQFFLNLSNYPIVWDKNITYLFQDIPGSNLVKHFLSKGINPFAGSLRASILISIYLGFDHAYLVGYDYTHKPSRILHWYEKGTGVIKDMPDYNKDFFDIAKEFIDLTTVTIDTGSNQLNHIKYEDLTGYSPVFKENTEIVQERYLKILASWPNYTIF